MTHLTGARERRSAAARTVTAPTNGNRWSPMRPVDTTTTDYIQIHGVSTLGTTLLPPESAAGL